MNPPNHLPNPAIVAQSAVRRFPRLALLLLCAAYILPGFLGREPWKNADITAFGYMVELARGTASWGHPTLMGLSPENDGLLPYWLGAWAMQIAPGWVAPDFAARIPFIGLLALTLAATWYGVYYLARSPRAQPVAFAFGGEARPADYARAMADGGLLALMACLGLAQLSHETTPSLVQVACTALAFYGVAALPWRNVAPWVGLFVGLSGLALSGAPAMAVLFGLGAMAVSLLDHRQRPSQGSRGSQFAHDDDHPDGPRFPGRTRMLIALGTATLLAAALAYGTGEWRWRVALPQAQWRDWRSLGRLLLWFTWPALPLALWTLWRWRRQLASRHVALPLWFAAVSVATTVITPSSDRSLLLALPALATLAAFALPTLRRSVAALVDWFTLLFFTGSAIIIWVVWIAMQTGVPRQPAANVAKLAPGFEPHFSALAFAIALAATLAWAWLVRWRAGRHRAALWKSLVLPAGGAALSWLLLTTLWLPLLDYARSYAPLVQAVTATMGKPVCVETYGLNRGQIAAFEFHAGLQLAPARAKAVVATGQSTRCGWLLVDGESAWSLPSAVDMRQWVLQSVVRRPADKTESVRVYRRAGN